MSLPPNPNPVELVRRVGRSWAGSTGMRARAAVSLGSIVRRRVLVTVTKFVLPSVALGLLALIAIWPELDRETRQAQDRMVGTREGNRMTNARYRGTDEHGRPYTLTAETAHQAGEGRVALVQPKGDMMTENGGWLMVQSRQGLFLQRSNQLDLSRDVMLYRADGMTLRTDAVAVDMKAGAAASASPVQMEGPLGTLDAQGFVLLDRGVVIQFTGPARMVINGAGQ
ncbi:MAG: LPS export ABC transporter periplasmic protein LptC [Acetobacteraceae bacterium]|nr:LPS export ABC transporter periplasmic protein LptC [Acetobacteraceae bacterium]MSP29804.1 LPS export ABC transporter periplasmic protein LptC [Acetobacteraceae bacterium]